MRSPCWRVVGKSLRTSMTYRAPMLHIRTFPSLQLRFLITNTKTPSLSLPLPEHTSMEGEAVLLPATERIEEENVTNYKADRYYPVELGAVFHSRYLVLAKLGFGTSSTVWLCRNLETQQLLTLKSGTAGKESPEVSISEYLQDFGSEHPGLQNLRVSLDHFELESPAGVHQCLVFEPLGFTYTEVRNMCPGKVLSRDMTQGGLNMILFALDLLHQAGVVHTDLSPNNIMMGVKDSSVWSSIADLERQQPSPRKILDGRTIYRSYRTPQTVWGGLPVITDFGEARFGEPGEMHTGDVMPDIYRAPEVILGMGWDSKIDIWCVGLMIWDLFEGPSLFRAVRDGCVSDEQHLAEMVSLLGPPPKAFLERSEKCARYWDSGGNWIASTPIPEQSLESRETRLEGRDKEILVAFARKVLRWLPEERASAGELLAQDDDFLEQFKASAELEEA